jgi:amidase
VAAGEVSCLELIEAHLTRIEALNPRLNAIVTVLDRAARAQAAAADDASVRGPLHGLPFTVKSDIDCLGSPTTRGVPALRHALPYADAPVVERLQAAGAIVVGRTNLSEMGLRLCADNPLHGRTRNPHDPALTAGGSSCGDAVAVAVGMTPLGIGGDMGGSLRVPAACCGCVTLKPTAGRVPHASSLPPRDYGLAAQLMLSIGPVVRSVRDLRLILPVLAGRDIRDPRSVDAPLDSRGATERVAGVVTSLPGAPLHASAIDAVRRAAASLEAAGWHVEEVTPPELPLLGDLFANLLAPEADTLAKQLEPVISSTLLAHLHRLAVANQARPLSAHTLHSERSRLTREWSQFFSEYPVLIGPTLGAPIWPVDADLSPTSGIELLRNATRFIVPGSVLGFPSLAMPVGVADGLPTSVQIYADLWREDLCLDAAITIENSPSPAAGPFGSHDSTSLGG